jgi:DNA-binding MarR family transcriptional regulator
MPVREPPTTALAHELRETVGRVVRRLRAEPGPSVGRLAVLGRLERDGPSSISDLAAHERMRPQSMAQTVHDLETAGLVSRRPDLADRRRAFVELTAAGLGLLQTTRAGRETWLTEVLERELDAGERALLHNALLLLSRIADASAIPRVGARGRRWPEGSVKNAKL